MTLNDKKLHTRFAIVGCGVSGISAYIEIIRRFHHTIKEIVIFDSSGIANGNGFNSILNSTITNTSVGVTSLIAEDKLDLYKWLSDKHPALNYGPQDFIPRLLVKEYCKDRLKSSMLFAEQFGCITKIIEKDIVEIIDRSGEMKLTDATGNIYFVDTLILATGLKYSDPYPELKNNKNYVANPYPESVFLSKINKKNSILIIGSKLSAIDVAIATLEHNSNAHVTMVSPSGILPSVRTELLIRPSSKFYSNLIFQTPMHRRARMVFLAAAKELRNKHELNKKYKSMHDAIESLEFDVNRCINTENNWQLMIGSMIDEINEMWPKMDKNQKTILKKRSKYFFSRYVSSFPLQNAKKILYFCKKNRLKIKTIKNKKCLHFENDGFTLIDAKREDRFDLVVNATGLSVHSFSSRLTNSLLSCDVKFNENGGVKLNTETMKVDTGDKNLSIYAIGGPASGEIMIINYIRASAIQARKIGNDLTFKNP